MATVGRSRSRRRGEGDGLPERNAAAAPPPTVHAVDHHGTLSRNHTSSLGILTDSLFASENGRCKPKKATGVPMKTLIDEEFSKDINSRRTSPGVVGRLMGLDSLPAYSQHRHTQRQKASPCSHDRYGFSEDIPHRRSTDEMPEVKDVFEVMEATRMKIHRSPRSKNGNATSRLDKTDRSDLDFIRQKFMDAKRLSTDESLQMSEEFNDTLDALVSNKDLLLEFLQKLDPVVQRDLQDHGSPSSTANCITILKPSRRNQFASTNNVNTQDKGTESYFHKKEEGKHSLREPYAKPSQSLKEDPGSLRQKLSRSSHQEISEKRVCPTRIVVLKPSLDKAQDVEGAFPLTHRIPHSDHRKHKACQNDGLCSPYTEEYMSEVSLGDSETLGHIAKGSREIAREITKQMRAARGGGSRKHVLKPERGTFMSDDRPQFLSSLSNLKTSEPFHRSSEPFDDWTSSSFNSSPAHSTEASVIKEAKKHLSNKCQATRQYQHQAAENNGFSMLGDMLALSDREASKVAAQTKSSQKCPKGELQKDRMSGSCNLPLGISSNDGWRDVTTSNLTRPKSLPSSFNRGVQKSNNRKRTSRRNEFSMLKDVLKVGPHDSEYSVRSRHRKSQIRGSTFHGDESDVVSSDNEERMIIEREIHCNSEEPTNGIAMSGLTEQTIVHPANPDHELDAVYYLDNNSAAPKQKKEPDSPDRQDQQMHQQPPVELVDHPLVPSLGSLANEAVGIEHHQDDDYPATCNPWGGPVSPVRINNHDGNQALLNPPTGSESPVSSNKDDQQSPVSVLGSSLDADEAYSGDFEKISADLQGLRMQLRLLKMETTDSADDTEPFTLRDDEITTAATQLLPDMKITHAFIDEEERDFSYVLDMLIFLGINAANQDRLLSMCHLSECPAGPDLFDILESKYNSLILWPPSERRLLFDLTNAVIAEIITSLMQHGSSRLLWRYSTRLDQEGFVEVVWQRVVQVRQEMDCIQGGIMMDLEWVGSEDGVDLVVKEIGQMLHDDLLEETIAGLLGARKPSNLRG